MEEYKYDKVPINPSIIEELIIELFNGKTIKRNEIVEGVLNHHIANGGLSPEAKDFPRSVKKALSNMSKKGWAINKTYGYWEINKGDSLVMEEIECQEDETKEEYYPEISAQVVYGNGSSSVYLYYFDTYKKLALSEGKKTWPCKIGRSDRDPLTRILSQGTTALPEKPTIEFVIKTNDSSLLETMLHSILKMRGQHIEHSPGSEWFNTNPSEVIELIQIVNKNLLDI
ncbi:GIY-YIG nuclease family protein [Bacillus sp. REN10]|uniref:GIY-YIG nuclease family protein n=1 Tax=Bacillus sp. REN10 TaxID=2782541 RepID=UPI00193C10DD|nr:GIY-YIG nuclease family protein [Bacillus sp. REN10]